MNERGVAFLISRFEGGGLLSQPTLGHLTGSFSVRATLQWMDVLLAALDCYNTFISLHIIKPNLVFGRRRDRRGSSSREREEKKTKLLFFFCPRPGSEEKSSFLKAVRFFLSELAARDLAAAESCFPLGERTSHFSPREVDQYNFSKCTIIVRLLEFGTMVLVKGDRQFWKVIERKQFLFGFFFFVCFL